MAPSLSDKPIFNATLQSILFLSGITALFFLLTNGVPLIQAGWIHELGKKGKYVRLMGISASVFAVFMFLVRWKFREIFEQSFWVKLWQAACRIPLRYAVAGFFVIYAAMMAWVGFERQLALETRAFDLGIFAQAVWNTLQGDFLFSSIKENINLMGDHVSPILLSATPFYAVWPDPRMLVLLQALTAASSFFPLALIARDKLKNRSLVLIFLLMLFFFQPMRAALHEDFHPEVLAEPFLWWAFFFLDRKQVRGFVLCLIAAVLGKENFLGIAFMLGFYAFVWKQMRLVGVLVMLSSAGLFIWETKWLVPYLTGTKYYYGGNYSIAISDPGTGILKKLIHFESLEYAFKVFMPFLFLPFFHLPTLILTFPVLFQNLLTMNSGMRSFNYHYFTGLTPFLFISTVYALARLNEQKAWARKRLLPVGFLILFVSVLRSGPSEYWFFWNIHSHRSAHTDMVREKLSGVPASARVLTHNAFIPQMCNRKYIYQFNYNSKPDKLEFVEKYKADTVVWDRKYWEPDTEPLESSLKQLQSAGFSVEFEKDGFYILKMHEAVGDAR
jgi:uncharacterized membrane protein